MKFPPLPFAVVHWEDVPEERHAGQTGEALWRTRWFGDIRVRMVSYSAGYLADHWCEKGHILLCVSGQLDSELADGRTVSLTPGMSFEVGDGALAHRIASRTGAILFIVD